jgi:hypothetical protein
MSNAVYVLQKDSLAWALNQNMVIEAGVEVSFFYDRYKTKSGWWFAKEFVENNPEWFLKKEEQQPKEWEVISYFRPKDKSYSSIPALYEGDNTEIHSVKRLSDGEVFTIGGKVNCDKCPESFSKQTIEKFIIADKGFMIASCAGVATSINNISKVTEQPKDKDVFQWNDELVKEFVISFNKIDKLITGVDPIGKTISEWKQSKSTPKEDKIQIQLLNEAYNSEGYKVELGYTLLSNNQIPPEKYEAVRKSIEQNLNTLNTNT